MSMTSTATPQAQAVTPGTPAATGRPWLDPKAKPFVQVANLTKKFGAFTAVDWLLCITGAILLPVIALWWFAG